MTGVVEVSIVVPCYNTGAVVADNMTYLVDLMAESCQSFEIIIVNDGSNQTTVDALEDVEGDGLINLVHLPANQGKGAALRAGMLQAKGSWVGFIDADGDIPFTTIVDFVETVRHGHVDGVVGSKLVSGAETAVSRSRAVLSRVYMYVTHFALELPVKDSQVGVKLFKSEMVKDVLPLTKEKGFAFDGEFLAVAYHRGWKAWLEVPVKIDRVSESTVTKKAALSALFHTFLIGRRVRKSNR